MFGGTSIGILPVSSVTAKYKFDYTTNDFRKLLWGHIIA